VSPAQKSSMATITAGALGRPAVRSAKGAGRYRFIGIEFTTNSSLFNYGLIELGRGEAAADLPHHIEIDRSYIHPGPAGATRRGIALNSADTVVKNSYIEGFGFPGEETQGICGWTGTRRVQIINNYIEGGAENIMFGGADPASADLIPTDIEVRGNHLNKPAAWAKNVTVKTLLELKNAKNVKVLGNLMTNNYKGSAFRITVRDQDGGAAFSTIEDVIIKDNVIDRAGEGINILGKDDTYPSETLKRLNISNNVFFNITGGGEFEGSGYFIQVADGEDITVTHNTVFNTGNIVTFYGLLPRSFLFKDNFAGHGSYGIHGPLDVASAGARTMFVGNIFLDLNHISKGDYSFPSGNSIVDLSQAGFANYQQQDVRLSVGSKFKGRASDGRDIGADINAPALLALR